MRVCCEGGALFFNLRMNGSKARNKGFCCLNLTKWNSTINRKKQVNWQAYNSNFGTLPKPRPFC